MRPEDAVPGRLYWLQFLNNSLQHMVLCRRGPDGRPALAPLPAGLPLDDLQFILEVPRIARLEFPGGKCIQNPAPEQVMAYNEDPREIIFTLA